MTALTTPTSSRSPGVPVPARQRGWHAETLLPLVALLAGAVYVGRDSLESIVDAALNDSESSHLLLVPIIAAWLAFVRRRRLHAIVREHTWVGPIVVALGGFMYVTGAQNMRFWTWHAGAVVMMVGALLSVVGTDALRKFGPAFLVLAFLAPMPPRVSSALTVPMMSGAALATEGVLNVLGVPVERTGNLLSINGTEVTVEEACAGMRGVWSLTLVAVAFAFATPFRTWVRVVVLLATPLLALVCNVIRLVPTVWVYGNYPEETAHAFHDMAGWAVLFVGYGLLTGLTAVMDAAGLPVHRQQVRSTEVSA